MEKHTPDRRNSAASRCNTSMDMSAHLPATFLFDTNPIDFLREKKRAKG
jgi:hypothetical protein